MKTLKRSTHSAGCCCSVQTHLSLSSQPGRSVFCSPDWFQYGFLKNTGCSETLAHTHTHPQVSLCLVKSTQQVHIFHHAYWHSQRTWQTVPFIPADGHWNVWKYCPTPNQTTAQTHTQRTCLQLLVVTAADTEVTLNQMGVLGFILQQWLHAVPAIQF